MKALKALVIIMGVLILIGSTVVVVTIFQRLSKPEAETAGAPAETAPPAAAFGARDLGLPAGSRIQSLQTDGGRIVVHVRLPDGGDRIVVVGLEDAEVLGTIDLSPAR